jgi:transposase-like protein
VAVGFLFERDEKKEKRIVDVEDDRELNVREERIKNSEILRIEKFHECDTANASSRNARRILYNFRSFANAKIRQYLLLTISEENENKE